MTNPWVKWWENLQRQWTLMNASVIQAQLLVLGAALLAALSIDRILEQYRGSWVGDPEQRRLRAILWATKYPALALLFGYVALSIYSATGRPSYTLQRLVSLFWFVLAYALAAKSVVVLLPAGEARRIIRRMLLPALAILGILHLIGLLGVIWGWATQPLFSASWGTVTTAKVLTAVAIAVAFWFGARLARSVFLRAVLPRTNTDPDLAESAASFVQFVVVVVGVWIAIATLGVQLSNLTLLISALTVGIGFGLQDVIKNVMGGMILLSEGYVRPNEVFEISGESGIVERIGIRSTTVRTWDGSQVIIPNSDLITGKITDMTDSRRVDIQVGVSTATDPRQVEQLLLELARSQPDVVADPAPSVVFDNFGESTFDFSLYCFVADRSQVIATRSALRYAIVETFDQQGVEMPFRQLDVHLRSGWSNPKDQPQPEG
ncbi:MAG: mechanosensitive ion channel family protein [Anaerolineae bacterium]|jgi:small-conductance mechanosensitive channel